MPQNLDQHLVVDGEFERQCQFYFHIILSVHAHHRHQENVCWVKEIFSNKKTTLQNAMVVYHNGFFTNILGITSSHLRSRIRCMCT